MTKTVTPTDQLLFDLFTTALEGGIGYWSGCTRYHNGKRDADGTEVEDLDGFYALILEYDEDDEDEMPEHRIDRAVVAKGYRLATTEWRNKLAWSSGEKPPLVVTADTDWDFDAGDADMIVQLGLFGDVKYG